jgi:uncharacterized membrane protein YeaQ/YmgE (transglycosylase-associated protein family)
MGFLSTLIVGLIAGALAKLLMPGKQGGGILITMALGVVGAFLANLLGHAAHWYRSPEEGPGIIASTVGALVVLAIYGAVTHRRGPLHH